MVCWSGRELRNTTRNALIMFVLNRNFADPSSKSVTQSGATCFETIDDLGGVDGLAGNSLEARSQDSATNFEMVTDELGPQIAHWLEHVDVLRQCKPASDEFVDDSWDIATSHMRKDARGSLLQSMQSERELVKLSSEQIEVAADTSCDPYEPFIPGTWVPCPSTD